jgi:hypothetical protein
MGRFKLGRLVFLAVLCSFPASPALVTYADLASWGAVATQSGATIDFSLLAPTPGSNSTEYAVLSAYEGVTFASTVGGDSVQVYNASASWTWYQWNSGAILRSGIMAGTAGMVVTLSTPVTAFAVHMGINNESGGTWAGSQMTVTVKNGATTLTLPTSTFTTSAHPDLTFLGIAATAGESFDTIIFSPAVNYVFLDDVMIGSYNAATELPEPGTGVLVLCGAVLLFLTPLRRVSARISRSSRCDAA